MRIGIEGLPLFYHRTGTSTYTHELVQNLRHLDLGDAVILFGRNQRQAGSSYHDISYSERVANYLYKNYRLPEELVNKRIDVYHSPRDMGLPKPGRIPCRTVMTLHDIILVRMAKDYYSRFRARLYAQRLLERMQHVDHVIAASEFSRKDVLDWSGLDPDKVSVVYNGVSEKFRPVTDAAMLDHVSNRYGLPSRFLLCVGSTEPRKNVSAAIAAFQRWRRGRHGLALVVTGANYNQLAPLEAFSGLDMEDVYFAGYIADSDMAAIYSLAELLLFPSLYEGFGLPPLEAMACETPVITANATSIPEIVGDAAVLVDPRDPAEIAAAIEMVLSPGQLREELVAKGQRRVSMFSWRRAAEETRKIYARAVADAF